MYPILIAFLVPALAGGIAVAVYAGKLVAAQKSITTLTANVGELQKQVAQLVHERDQAAQTLISQQAEREAADKRHEQEVAQLQATIGRQEAQLAKVLDPQSVGERARDELSGGAPAAPAAGPGGDPAGGGGSLPHGSAPA